MSRISIQDVEYVAGLAQLAPDQATKERLVGELSKILDYVAKLNELDTTGIEPMMHFHPMTNVLRDDVVAASLTRDEALKNAPSADGEYFIVPRIIDME